MLRLDTLHLYDTSMRSYIYIYIHIYIIYTYGYLCHPHGAGFEGFRIMKLRWLGAATALAKLGADSFIGIGFALWLCQQFANLNMAIGIVDFYGCSPEIW